MKTDYKTEIWEMINLCEKTFSKDDIENTDHDKLKKLVLVLYDKLYQMASK